MNVETDKLNEDLTQIWRTARNAMNSADELWNIFINLVEQESIDYYVAKTLRQSLKTEIKDAVEYADKLSELCHTLNRKLNENATKNYKKVFFLKFIVNADMKDGEGMRPARLCNDCRQKLFDELVRSNERDNGTTK